MCQVIPREGGCLSFNGFKGWTLRQNLMVSVCVNITVKRFITIPILNSLNHSINQSTNQPTNQPTNQASKQSINQWINESISQMRTCDKLSTCYCIPKSNHLCLGWIFMMFYNKQLIREKDRNCASRQV